MDATTLANLTSQITESTSRIQNNVNIQANLIAQALEAIANKSAGSGGSVNAPDTCSIMIGTVGGSTNLTWHYTAYESGSVVNKTETTPPNMTINNVLCNSLIVVTSSTNVSQSAVVSGVTLISDADTLLAFRVTAAAGASGQLLLM